MNKAFTLIELLVVVAIIGILASIILVSLQGAKDQAELAEAQSFARQMRSSLGLSLVGEWRLNDGVGNSAVDSSGYGNDGDWNGTGIHWTTDGIYNGAGIFNGLNDSISCGSLNIDQSNTSVGITIEAWVYPTSVSSGRHMVISTDDGGYDWSLLREGSVWHVFTGASSYATGFSVELNQWQHIVAVFVPGDGVRFYKNAEGITTSNISYDASDNNVSIGDNPGPWNEYFIGIIDEVRIYDEVLSSVEIQQLYVQGTAKHNLVFK